MNLKQAILIERLKVKRRMNIAVICGGVSLVLAFFNWGFITHTEGQWFSRILLFSTILLLGGSLLVYRQMLRDWKTEDARIANML